MIKIFLFLQAIVFFSANQYLMAQTNINGFINQNTTWNLAGSPYIVNGNTLLSHGYTLLIEPGVVVKFDTNKALQINGELIAIGTAQSRIQFISAQLVPEAGDWAKIHFADTCEDAVFDAIGNYLSGCIMKYCDVMYGGSAGFGNIHIESSSPYISQSIIANSSSAGIYCNGSIYLIDSSLVSDNSGYGLFVQSHISPSCNYRLNGDTLRNNMGGLYLSLQDFNCTTTITNNYFISNYWDGAIFFNPAYKNVRVEKNFFLNNSAPNSGFIVGFLSDCSQSTIAENQFINNSQINLALLHFSTASADTIRCNLFLNNQMNGGGGRVISLLGSGIIRNNIFDGNTNTSPGCYVVLNIRSYNMDLLDFSNNIIRNNTAPSGGCCRFDSYDYNNNRLLHIEHNEFLNNTAQTFLFLDGHSVGNSGFDFLYLKRNNFRNPNVQHEFYNNIPYGSPDAYIDSNYWGTTSTQHIDSVIYDYFDFANQSITYYLPVLTSPEVIDTACPVVSIGINELEGRNVPSVVFPNPFNRNTTIRFDKVLHHAYARIFDTNGKCVRLIGPVSGKEIQVPQDNLSSGIYFYSATVKDGTVYKGKLIVE